MSVAKAVRSFASAAMVAGALVAAPSANAQCTPITTPSCTPTSIGFFGNGGPVTVKYVFSDAGNNSQLLYKVGAFSANIGDYTPLFINNSPASPLFQEIILSPVALNEEVVFMLHNITTGNNYFTGDPTRNPLGEIHVSLIEPIIGGPAIGGGEYGVRFGFEDVQPVIGGSDQDYNDLQFEIANVRATETITPEPSSYALMAAGLLALGVAARRRKV